MFSKGQYIHLNGQNCRRSSKNSCFLYISPYNIRIISRKCCSAKYFFRRALIFGENSKLHYKSQIRIDVAHLEI